MSITVLLAEDQRMVLGALGSLLAICTLGVPFIPVLFSADRRAVHDRLAGTRVVIA